MRVEVSQLPPAESSPNARVHWTKRREAESAYRNAVFYSCVDARNRGYLEGREFPLTWAKLHLTFIFPQQRQRDRDNLLSSFKAGLDAIVSSGLILDDDAEHLEISGPDILIDPERAPLTVIELDEIKRLEKEGTQNVSS